jgi:hypothetical protein
MNVSSLYNIFFKPLMILIKLGSLSAKGALD